MKKNQLINFLILQKEGQEVGGYDLLTFSSLDAVVASPGSVVTRQVSDKSINVVRV